MAGDALPCFGNVELPVFGVDGHALREQRYEHISARFHQPDFYVPDPEEFFEVPDDIVFE